MCSQANLTNFKECSVTLGQLLIGARNKGKELEAYTERRAASARTKSEVVELIDSEQDTYVLMNQELDEIFAAVYRQPWFHSSEPNVWEHEIPPEIAARAEKIFATDFNQDRSSEQKPS